MWDFGADWEIEMIEKISEERKLENLLSNFAQLEHWAESFKMQNWRSYDENIIISGNCRETPHSALLEDELQEIDAAAHLDISIE